MFTRKEPTFFLEAEGHGDAATEAETAAELPRGRRSSARAHMPHAREPGDLENASPSQSDGTQLREGKSRNTQSQTLEESDAFVVAEKLENSWVTPEDPVERRDAADGKIRSTKRASDTDPNWRANALERIGQRAKEKRGEKFTNLLSHIKVPLMKEAYMRLRKNAAPGVDGETWNSYGEQLDVRLHDLEGRVHRGSYHPQPVRRVYISKVDGKRRPLGIPALEDKIVQQAARMLMEPLYERGTFLGFSYGFRPGRSQHGALDALAVAIECKKVSWVLEADIRAFFDTIDHAWMQKMIEHRIGDRRFVRLLLKWLHAGVMEEGKLYEQREGTPQGGIISPLLANVFLHYALDLWVQQWRKKQARGQVYIVRYADDFVMGFQYEEDARAMHEALALRLAKFGLELHPDKTRIIRFGRFASADAVRDGRAKPETFDFLGFTHLCGRSRAGGFQLQRHTSLKKRRAKLAALREEFPKRRHLPVVDQHRWLCSVIRGHNQYYGVPTNSRTLAAFRRAVERAWHRSLQRRSQRAGWTVEKTKRFEKRFALPSPRIVHPWPSQRLHPP